MYSWDWKERRERKEKNKLSCSWVGEKGKESCHFYGYTLIYFTVECNWWVYICNFINFFNPLISFPSFSSHIWKESFGRKINLISPPFPFLPFPSLKKLENTTFFSFPPTFLPFPFLSSLKKTREHNVRDFCHSKQFCSFQFWGTQFRGLVK